jgi:surfactin synthase thioesterase subunit/glycosyltransferase involved in cell wall biosynthesis
VRILLAHNSLYYPSHGGGDKSNRLLMEALAARGHTVRVISRVEKFEPKSHDKLILQLASRAVPHQVFGSFVQFETGGVDVRTLTLDPNLRAFFSDQIGDFDPDIILTSTDDPGQLLFELALRAPRARVVHLVRATIAVPFGPDSSSPNRPKTELLRAADTVVGVSDYVASYIREYSDIPAVHVPISLMEPGDYHDVGRFDSPFVTMVNPCAVKGIDIFVALADRLPDLRFAAVPTWGTNSYDLDLLGARPNITLLDPVDNIEDLLRQTRVMLVPSLWAEARSRMVVEAMLREVPVIASDAGGIREAKLGTPYLIPVNLIRHYKPALDENLVPVAEIPPQNIEPWRIALERLTTDAQHWQQIARESREAALRYVDHLSVEPFERLLSSVLERPKKFVPPHQPSDSRRRLATMLLKHRSGTGKAPAWFPTLQPRTAGDARLRLFCFPHAGGGTRIYRAWTISGVEICPVLLPGRESRMTEPPIDNMPEMVAALTTAIQPYLNYPFAFFGHSMGAGIAFEMTRALENKPQALIVSAARAPQYRENLEPSSDPPDEELLRQLTALGGDSNALESALPLLRADTRLYRNYRFTPSPPLPVPIAAYGGTQDPNVRPEHLEPWGELSTKRFVRREFQGGHFYLETQTSAVCAGIAEDLAYAGT